MNQYVTKDQLKDLTSHINDLSGQIEDIEDRITSFGKP
jgi:flagellar hook-associated protein FlgK